MTKLEALRAKIRQGIESGEATKLDIEDVISRGKARAAQRQNTVEEL